MGVHGLWELLSPVGHRVSNESVRNKILAIDVSIWLTQFVKAMRDAEGAQVRNSHLLGVFRRCVKLLYLSVKPVLVFDGATPALKRRTLSSRRAQREKHAAKLRRLAEKMLLNRIKQRNISHAIAKRRKGKQRRPTMAPKTSSTLRNESRHDPRYLEKSGPVSEENTGWEQEAVELPENTDELTRTREKRLSDPDYMITLDSPSEDSGIDDMEISIPQNVDDLDDEVLMKLPTKLQTEVFKQVKLEQRARHRESMMLKRQDPSEFSKMQIEGFLRHTALNRKISRVRNVINFKSGASQRIASDSGRKFILEEGAVTGIAQGIDESASDDDHLEKTSPKIQSGSGDNTDLLASIRARKETIFQEAEVSAAQHQAKSLQEPRPRESGTGWASKVLEANGSLNMELRIPGESALKDRSQLVSCVDEDSNVRHAKQLGLHRKNVDDSVPNRVLLDTENSNANDSTSDEDEWEDGDQPKQYDLSDIFDKDLGQSDVKLSKFNNNSERKEHPTLLEPLPAKPSSQNSERNRPGNDSREPQSSAHEMRRGSNMEDTTACRRDFVTSNESDKAQGECQRFDSTISTPFPSTTAVPDGLRTQHRAGHTHEHDIEVNPKFVLDEVDKGSNAVELHRSNSNPPGEKHTRSQSPLDNLRLEIPAQARTAPAEDPAMKPIPLLSSKEPKKSDQRKKPGRSSTSKNVDEDVNIMPSAPTRNDVVATGGCTAPPSSKTVVPHESQAVKGHNTEMERLDVHARSLNSSRQSKHILLNSTDEELSNSCERRIGNRHYDVDPENGVDTLGSKTDSSDKTRTGLNRSTVSGQKETDQPSFAQLESMQEELQVEALEIERQRYSHQGGADSVADEMYAETRDLIKLFGIPYLEAPMEAEAQCAFLNKEKIVDGVLTEDSDAFLFGALTVYRQLFAEGRFAEAYDANNIKRNLALDRESLIRLAYLLGSDYTAGVRGVGIVNSMEILEAFPGPSGLGEFREWMNSVTVLDKEPEEEIMSSNNQEAVRRRFCWKHRIMKRNWEVREGFPNPAVFEAYMNPVVDTSREKFTWGPVNFEGLARFCWEKFGWEKDRFDRAVGPLHQQLREKSRTNQRRIDEFFEPHRFAKIRSERLQRAVHGMAGNSSNDLMATQRRTHRTRKINPVMCTAEQNDFASDEVTDHVTADRTKL